MTNATPLQDRDKLARDRARKLLGQAYRERCGNSLKAAFSTDQHEIAISAILTALTHPREGPPVSDADLVRQIHEARMLGWRDAMATARASGPLELIGRLQKLKAVSPSIYGPLIDQACAALSAHPREEIGEELGQAIEDFMGEEGFTIPSSICNRVAAKIAALASPSSPPEDANAPDLASLIAGLREMAVGIDEDWAADNQSVLQGGPRADGDPCTPRPRNLPGEAADYIASSLNRVSIADETRLRAVLKRVQDTLMEVSRVAYRSSVPPAFGIILPDAEWNKLGRLSREVHAALSSTPTPIDGEDWR